MAAETKIARLKKLRKEVEDDQLLAAQEVLDEIATAGILAVAEAARERCIPGELIHSMVNNLVQSIQTMAGFLNPSTAPDITLDPPTEPE